MGEVLADLDARFPDVGQLIFDDQRRIPAHVNVYVNNREIPLAPRPETLVQDGDEVAVIPAIATVPENRLRWRRRAGQQPAGAHPRRVMRYSRHIIMPRMAQSGSAPHGAKVLIVGAGGLGSPLPSTWRWRASAIGIVTDFDVVDLSSLQRQILHQSDDVGKPKVVSARGALGAYNPDVNVVVLAAAHLENALEIIPQYDIVVNGSRQLAPATSSTTPPIWPASRW
ncbi:MAG: ThiF family adenylyltransferase [Dehalococcoidia bacterium]